MLKEQGADYNFGELWLGMLEERFGKVNEIKEVQAEGKPMIHILYFDSLPEEGYTTAVTAGLSFAHCPEWKNGKPELMVVMDSSSRDWGFAAGYFASAFLGRGDSATVIYSRWTRRSHPQKAIWIPTLCLRHPF